MLLALRWPRLRSAPMNFGVQTAPRFPWAGLMLAIAFSTVWTALFLTQNNLEVQSIDLCHHVMFVDHLKTPFGVADTAFTGQYPLLSHRVAAAWLPLYRNPIMAVRAAALASLLIMLLAQWRLLRTAFRPATAIILLVGWQALCTSCKLGDVNHFLWDFQYNYSRAVSAAALWVMLLSFAVPPSRHRILNLLFSVGCAAFAFRCHIAAGSLALAACGTWCLLLLRRDRAMGLSGVAMLAVTGGMLLLFTDEWRYLAGLATENGPLPIRHADLIALWIPTAVLGLVMFIRATIAVEQAGDSAPSQSRLVEVVLCGLLPAAVLQGYMLYGKTVSHIVGSYPYNQMLFYTFGLASLFWVAFLARCASGGVTPSLALRADFQGEAAWLKITAILAAGWGLYTILETDVRRTRAAPERDPICVLAEIRSQHSEFRGAYYYDPDLEHASYFISRCVLGAGSDYCGRYRLHLHQRKPWQLFREPELKTLYLPGTLDPAVILGPHCPVQRTGSFWRCDMARYRTMPEFDVFVIALER